MCLVSVLKKGTKKNTKEVHDFIKSGFECNEDGSGYMFKRNGENTITVKKGFFGNAQEMIDSIVAQNLNDDDELAVHHRIRTHGLASKENTHPFVCTHKHDEVIALDITTDKPCLVHNGYFWEIKGFININPDFSDTYAFARYVMGNPSLMEMYYEDQKKFEKTFSGVIASSKICILHPDKDLTMVGNFVEKNGYFHSNDGYCRYVFDKGGSSTLKGAKYSKSWDKHTDWDNKHVVGFGRHSGGVGKTKGAKKEAKVVSMLPKSIVTGLRKFNGEQITITSKNFGHFEYVAITHYEAFKDKSKLIRYNIGDYKEGDNWIMLDKITTDERPYGGYEGILPSSLVKDYYYVPKKEKAVMYGEYLRLIAQPDIGGKTLKKLKNLLQRNINKQNDTPLFYKKLGTPISKGALLAYRDHLEQLEKANAPKVVDNDEVLNHSQQAPFVTENETRVNFTD